ncbi:MAG: polysaccharide lyase [Verrucomicrobiaceae bacterium]
MVVVQELRPAMRLFHALVFCALSCVCAAQAQASSEVRVSLTGDPGPYTLARWKQDWPGCGFQGGITEGRVSLWRDGRAVPWLRVAFAQGQIGPENGGTGWRWPFAKRESAELSYVVQFSKDFDWVKGGKLPGLCGGPDNVSGGRPATGTNGFSARLMWRKDGRGEAYVYHKNQPERYGESFPFPARFRFPTEAPIRVRLAVTMNTLGKRDGSLRVLVALGDSKEQELVMRNDMEWRTVGTFGVDSLYFESFHGGSDATWAPTRACWAEFADFLVK